MMHCNSMVPEYKKVQERECCRDRGSQGVGATPQTYQQKNC